MKAWWSQVQTRFDSLNRREQRLVLGAGLFVLLALVWWLALEPALQGRARLNQQLPALRLQASELAGLAAQGNPYRRVSKSDGLDSLSASLTTAGFDAKSAERIDEERVRVKLSQVDYGRVLAWIAETRTLETRLESASISLQEPGRVNVELIFQRGNPGSRDRR
jgi:general secretion pathway protein M